MKGGYRLRVSKYERKWNNHFEIIFQRKGKRERCVWRFRQEDMEMILCSMVKYLSEIKSRSGFHNCLIVKHV